MSYVYLKTRGESVWGVGFFGPNETWMSESDYTSPGEAAARVHYLNGGSDAELRRELDQTHAALSQTLSEMDRLRAAPRPAPAACLECKRMRGLLAEGVIILTVGRRVLAEVAAAGTTVATLDNTLVRMTAAAAAASEPGLDVISVLQKLEDLLPAGGVTVRALDYIRENIEILKRQAGGAL